MAVRALSALVATIALLLTPLIAVPPAAAQLTIAPHWGISPYYPNCVEGPCRVVVIADKTQHAGYQLQIQRWVYWMNYARTTYNLNWPAFAYVPLGDDPGCAVADGIISVCRNDAVVNEDCGPDTGVLRCGEFNIELGVGHFLSARVSYRTRDLDAADTWTVVCAQLGRAVGMPPSANASSCLYEGGLQLGSGVERYYVIDDWLYYYGIYDHSPID